MKAASVGVWGGARAGRRWALLATVLLAPAAATALINPSLQPVDLYNRYVAVLVGEVAAVDAAAQTVGLRVTKVHKGEFAPKQVTVVATGDMRDFIATLADEGKLVRGRPFVAFVGKRQRRHEGDLMLYWGSFALGRLAAKDQPDKWLWDAEDVEAVGVDGREVPSLGGTWNGETAQLAQMVADIAAGRAFFPRRAYVRFRPPILLEKLAKAARGVALYDIDGDGRLDVYACGDAGDRAYLQLQPMQFADATKHLRLDGIRSAACSFADVNADGRADLLTDGQIHLQGADGFAASKLLPSGANEKVKSAAFAELNGDGWPDVVISRTGGGLRAYLNAGGAGKPFRDVTAAMGLDAGECGAGGDGFFAIGDWNGDGRADLFYAAGQGLLLVQDAKGRFAPVKHDIPFEFASGERGEPGLTGAGCFLPLLAADRLGLIVPTEDGWHVVDNRKGEPVDVTEYGNEISEGSYLHLASIAADFNLDGYTDFYTVSRQANGHNRLILHRGYGSFMLASVHKVLESEELFPGPTHRLGGWGVAAGDVNDDGAPDLLIANSHGHVALIVNDTLSLRKPVEHPTDDVRRLLEVRVLSVRVRGRVGVVGARVSLVDADGRPVGLGEIAANVATGCRGPDAIDFAVRHVGKHVLTVRFSDGTSRSTPVDLTGKDRRAVTVVREIAGP